MVLNPTMGLVTHRLMATEGAVLFIDSIGSNLSDHTLSVSVVPSWLG